MAGVSIVEMVGHLNFLWWWALDFAKDGDLSGYEAEDIADAAMWTGDPEKFVNALLKCGRNGSSGFLRETESGLVLHDWDDYGGKYHKQREQSRNRMAKRRKRSQPDVDVTRNTRVTNENVTRNTRESSRLEENRGEEKRKEENRGENATATPLIRLYMDASGETGHKSEKWRKWFDDVTGRYSRKDCIAAFEKMREDIINDRLAGKTKWERCIWHLEHPESGAVNLFEIPDIENLDYGSIATPKTKWRPPDGKIQHKQP